MRSRILLQMTLGLLIAFLLIACTVVFQFGGDVTAWFLAHRDTKMVWLVDFCVLFFVLLLGTLLTARGRLQRQTVVFENVRTAHREQMEALLDRNEALEKETALQQERMETLLGENTTPSGTAELTLAGAEVPTLRGLQAQMAAQARQMEAMSLALQHNRAEIAQLRQQMRFQREGRGLPHAHISDEEMNALWAETPLLLTEDDETEGLEDELEEEIADAEEMPRIALRLDTAGTPEAELLRKDAAS